MSGAEAVGFIDDDPVLVGGDYEGLPVWSGRNLAVLAAHGVNALATHIARSAVRLDLRDRASQAGLTMANVVHGRAWVSNMATMGVGNLIKAGAVVDTHVSLGDCCIVDNGVVLPHHNRIGNGCHLAPGAIFGGNCEVGEGTIIGVGATISPRTRIGSNVLVGVGACVVRDIPDNAVVEGQPARIVGNRK
jgi:sugar O-acyltransferase (sialic acid O-acetyltransferase NeuD family)